MFTYNCRKSTDTQIHYWMPQTAFAKGLISGDDIKSLADRGRDPRDTS